MLQSRYHEGHLTIGETEAWRGKEMGMYLKELEYESMSSDVNAFPLTTLPLVCSLLPVPRWLAIAPLK